jgi:hypothetical protein
MKDSMKTILTVKNVGAIFFVIRSLVLTSPATSAQAIDVAVSDPNLNAAIHEALQKPSGPLSVADLLSLTNLEACCRNISSLEGLQAARNLMTLDLSKNSLTNLTLPAGLSNLTSLFLQENSLTNFTLPPELSHLARIDLAGNSLTSLTLPLGLTNLSTLDLAANQIGELTLPPDLAKLTFLFLESNPLNTLVLSEPLALTNLAEIIATLQSQNVSVFTFPLNIRLTLPRRTDAGAFQFALIGPPGIYTLLGSDDLAVWSELGVLTNQLGLVRFSDLAPLSPQKFYAARLLETGLSVQLQTSGVAK